MDLVAARSRLRVLGEKVIELARNRWSPDHPSRTEDTANPKAFDRLDFVATYEEHTRNLKAQGLDESRALELAIGGEFDAIGALEFDLVVQAGLTPDGSLIDIGCGSGRLAVQLRSWLGGSYLGTDVVQDLLDHAVAITARPEWRFERVTGLSIPADDGSADVVCAFSVFTHLLHEESYAYLQECHRVLKPGGTLVFSFLEFRVPSHWAVFDSNLAAIASHAHLNQFMSVDGVTAWAKHLDFEIREICRGDEPHIPLSRPIVLNGQEYVDLGTLGQSVAFYTKPAAVGDT